MLQTMLRFSQTAYATTRRVLGDAFFERPIGIETSKPVTLRELGLGDDNRADYDPSPWLALARILPKREVAATDVFIGSGKGRVVVQAAGYAFRKVIGVELSPALHGIAVDNIARSRPKLHCKDVDLVNEDALTYVIPDDVTVAYFYNPFSGEIFAGVIERLAASVRRNPRHLRIICLNPAGEAVILAAGATLTREARGLRPGKNWSRSKSIRMYTLSPDNYRATARGTNFAKAS